MTMPVLWPQINDLKRRAGELKRKGDFRAMLPLWEEAARLLEAHQAGPEEIASAWNYVAYINRQIGDFIAAEKAARHSLAVYRWRSRKQDEFLATYLFMLATVLDDQ